MRKISSRHYRKRLKWLNRIRNRGRYKRNWMRLKGSNKNDWQNREEWQNRLKGNRLRNSLKKLKSKP